MRVLFLIDSLSPGGAETSTVALASELTRLGVEPAIVTLRTAVPGLEARATSAGVEVRCLDSTSLVSRVRETRCLIRSRNIDVVHTALFDADQVGRLAAWRTGVPLVSSFVNTPYHAARFDDATVKKWKVRLFQLVDSVTGRVMVDRFHAVSEGVKEDNARALRIPLDRITVAERGRDPELLGKSSVHRRIRVRETLGIGVDVPVVLNLGRLDRQKAHTVLIAASSMLADRFPKVVVLIAGKDGSATAEVHAALAADEVAAKHVRLLGHRADVGDLLCAADVVAISSHFEGTAGVAVEAMALSTPIVSTDLVGVHGILAHDVNAVLVPRNDPAALADGIARVLDDEALAKRLAERSNHDFATRFTLDAAARRLLDLYEGLASDA